MKKTLLVATALVTSLLSACTVSPNTGDVEVIAQPVPIAVPIIIDIKADKNEKAEKDKNKEDDADKPIYACTLSAFTSQYRAENTNRGKARLNVKKQCLNQFNEMFCQDKDIKCTEYN
ncbi:hypothetical protein [Psychrobacter phenylpyruvicus]|uniref:Lipoprotein n=1 Tax=Psychrobacter phenylpyruvicus TaxID=29432 RepID=A0A379LI69_9GAMM|nr:hypothetical protein [Psychrobacter phenylpyruvicus]SUD90299.1 Uncharacterised protein [Psychrobacter phenylpyruvicus]